MLIELPDPEATDELGRALAATRPRQAVVYLHGDLGAGKSTLARALLRGLGVVGPVRSPTYTLVERYPLGQDAEALHLDLYRIGAPGELEYLGLDESGAALWLVEWPERGGDALPAADLHVHLELDGAGRRARLAPGTGDGARWLDRLGDGPDLRPTAEPQP